MSRRISDGARPTVAGSLLPAQTQRPSTTSARARRNCGLFARSLDHSPISPLPRRYRREAVVASHPSPVVAYAIASVFTPERHRRKGYASHLMRLLHFILADPSLLPPFPVASWGEPPTIPLNARFPYATAIASALYSDVGATFYRLCGPGLAMDAAARDRAWIEHDPFSTIWPVADPETPSDDVRWIPERALWDVWDRDAAAIRREIGLLRVRARDDDARRRVCLSAQRRRGAVPPRAEQIRHSAGCWRGDVGSSVDRRSRDGGDAAVSSLCNVVPRSRSIWSVDVGHHASTREPVDAG